jgi:hypothetical protein
MESLAWTYVNVVKNFNQFYITPQLDLSLGSEHSTVQYQLVSASVCTLDVEESHRCSPLPSFGTIIHFTCYTDHDDENDKTDMNCKTSIYRRGKACANIISNNKDLKTAWLYSKPMMKIPATM